MPSIEFQAISKYFYDVALRPYPAKQSVPDWFKNVHPYEISEENPSGKKMLLRNYESNATFKKCTPMLDALTSGYIIPLWSDVQITNQEKKDPLITWKVRGSNVFEIHGPSSNLMPAPTGYYSQAFKFINGWRPIVPKGYSMLITQPFGYRDTPFHAVPAIIDDSVTLEIVPPVWVKKDFEGIVEKGTPMIQLTLFKREKWKSNYTFITKEENDIIQDRDFNGTIQNHYIKNFWKRKEYE
jgi:hypothetical protein